MRFLYASFVTYHGVLQPPKIFYDKDLMMLYAVFGAYVCLGPLHPYQPI